MVSFAFMIFLNLHASAFKAFYCSKLQLLGLNQNLQQMINVLLFLSSFWEKKLNGYFQAFVIKVFCHRAVE